jgi:hypothetical protein
VWPHRCRRVRLLRHHTKLLATTDAETMRRGRTPKSRATKKRMLRVVTEPAIDVIPTTTDTAASGDATTKTMAGLNDHANAMTTTVVPNANVDPSTVWQDARDTAGPNGKGAYSRILETTSTDGGDHWTDPIVVSESPAGISAFLPAIAVASNGTVG